LHGLRDHAARLADAVGAVLDQGSFPIVLGGDCTILLGITLALRRRGRYGLLFLDGHADFYQPEAEPTGEAASMELALVTGRGRALVTALESRRPRPRTRPPPAHRPRGPTPAAPRRGRGGVRVPRRRACRRRGKPAPGSDHPRHRPGVGPRTRGRAGSARRPRPPGTDRRPPPALGSPCTRHL